MQFSEGKVGCLYSEQEQLECRSMENLSVGHENDANKIHSPKTDRIQTPEDRHGEKHICCEGYLSTVTVEEPVSIVSTNPQLREILASVLQSVKEANEKLQLETIRVFMKYCKMKVCLRDATRNTYSLCRMSCN
jgi:hypothetical protein